MKILSALLLLFALPASAALTVGVESPVAAPAYSTAIDRVVAIASSADGSLQPAVEMIPFGMVVAYSRMAMEPEDADVHRVFVRAITSTVAERHRVVAR